MAAKEPATVLHRLIAEAHLAGLSFEAIATLEEVLGGAARGAELKGGRNDGERPTV
jgi:hypothetical protein